MSDPTKVSRRLVAVFAADVEGYSRLMGADEVCTLKGLTERRAILDRIIGEYKGRMARPTRPSARSKSLRATNPQGFSVRIVGDSPSLNISHKVASPHGKVDKLTISLVEPKLTPNGAETAS